MYSTYLRGAAYAVVVAPIAAFLAYMLKAITSLFDAPSDHMLVQLFDLTAQHFLLIGLVSVGVMVIARAVVESSVGGGR